MDKSLDLLASETGLVIKFASSSERLRTVPVGVVIDFDSNGEAIGVEIINLKHQAGACVLEGLDPERISSNGKARVSYDAEADAFYVSLSNVHSADQAAVEGKVVLSEKGHMVAIEADLTPPSSGARSEKSVS